MFRSPCHVNRRHDRGWEIILGQSRSPGSTRCGSCSHCWEYWVSIFGVSRTHVLTLNLPFVYCKLDLFSSNLFHCTLRVELSRKYCCNWWSYRTGKINRGWMQLFFLFLHMIYSIFFLKVIEYLLTCLTNPFIYYFVTFFILVWIVYWLEWNFRLVIDLSSELSKLRSMECCSLWSFGFFVFLESLGET
jgi:hypothetical protein